VPSAAWHFVRDGPLALVGASGVTAAVSERAATLTPPQAVLLAIALILPGAALLLVVWIGLRLVFRHAGVGGVLLNLNARPPKLEDIEERQLTNVVEEMAIAAGVPPPRVMLIDAEEADGAANAAAVGWSIDDATIIVTRPLLDQLRRDETQAIIARLIGAVGNGDLKIALVVLSLFQTVGVATLALNAVFSRQSRTALWQLLKLSFMPRSARGRQGLATDVMTLLATGADSPDALSGYLDRHRQSGCRSALQLPLLLGVGFPIFTSHFIVSMSTATFTGPVIGAMWKQRELLADATAVQLTRNPDGLAAALERLAQLTVRVPRGDAISHLFAIWGKQQGLTPDQAALYHQALDAAGESNLGRARALAVLAEAGRADARAKLKASSMAGTEPPGSGVVVASQYMHAKLERRMDQLQSFGAHVDPAQRPVLTPIETVRFHGRKTTSLGWVLVGVLVAVLAPLLGLAFLLIMMLDVMFMTIMLLAVWLLSHLVFVTGPTIWRQAHR
jgi:Zn-dependent protease with chaperone function